MDLKELDKNIWVASQPFALMGVNLGTRMTIVRLENDELLVYSPIKLTPTVRSLITELGEVKYVVAPNEFHYLYAKEFVEAFSGSQFYCVKGLVNKLKRKPHLLPPHQVLEFDKSYPWDFELSNILLEGGNMYTEYMLFHMESKTLIATDIMFNFQNTDDWKLELLLKLNGCYKKANPSRLLKYILKNKKEANRVFSYILKEWDFERLILAHGEIIESGAKRAIQKGFSYLL